MDETKPVQQAGGPVVGAPLMECWKIIGVLGGDHTCPELVRYVHCRNCPIHAEAGAKLLDRALPPGYREEWTRRLNERKADAVAGKKSAVIFRVGGEWLALPTEVFQEVAERRVIHSLPHQRNDCVLGLANVRGELLLCLSFGRLLGFEPSLPPAGTTAVSERLLVVGWHGHRQAFPVDEVFGVHRYHPQELQATPGFMPVAAFTRGLLEWQGRTVAMLNEEQLFNNLSQNIA